MTKVNYDIDYTELDDEDFDLWMNCCSEVAGENDLITHQEFESYWDTLSETYHDQICERFHYEKLKGKRTVGIGEVDVYEITDEGALNFFKRYENRNHLRMFIKEVFKLDNAFAVSPDNGIGYVIHGDVQKCKDYLTDLSKIILSAKECEDDLHIQ